MDVYEASLLATVNDRVARGAAWLDRAYPSWESRLFDRIDIGSGHFCVLGQLFGDFMAAQEATPDENGWLIEHGFLLDEDEAVSYEHLTGAWEALAYAQGGCGFLQDLPAEIPIAA